MIQYKLKKIFSIITIFSLLSLNLLPLNSYAKEVAFYEINPDFNPNNIISDSDVTDYNSMTIEQIRDFANQQGGTLGTYLDPASNMPAYWLIWQASQEFRINPKFILTMLQKEQSLVTDPNPTQNQYNWAVGYSCYGGVCLDKYKGFTNQIRGMANKVINSYIADLNVKGLHKNNFFCTFTKWCVGDAKQTQDFQLIIPQNKATAALYTYNPYQGGTTVDGYKIGANYNFWKIWTKWFKQLVLRPTGSIMKAVNSDKVYLIQNGQKRPFANFSSFITRYSPDEITIVDQSELDQYQIGAEIKFAQYSLLQNSTGDIFLLVDDALEHIASMDVFRTLGFNPEEIEQVDDQDLVSLKTGPEITIASSYPTGELIQDAKTGGIYFVQLGVKYPILAKELIKANYPGKKILSGHSEELEKYPKGEPIKFKDGTLIKSQDNDIVYLIAGNKKLPIEDDKSFESRGYKWNKIIETNQIAVNLHPTGGILGFLDTSFLKKTTPEPLPTIINDQTQNLESNQNPEDNFDLINKNTPATTTATAIIK